MSSCQSVVGKMCRNVCVAFMTPKRRDMTPEEQEQLMAEIRGKLKQIEDIADVYPEPVEAMLFRRYVPGLLELVDEYLVRISDMTVQLDKSTEIVRPLTLKVQQLQHLLLELETEVQILEQDSRDQRQLITEVRHDT